MTRLRLALAIALTTGLALAALSGVAGARASTTIKVDDNFFAPSSKTVAKGTKVKFKWVGSNNHNVVKQSGPGSSFSSPTTNNRGVNFKRKFKKSGTYKLICTIHQGMKVKLKVN